LHVTYQIIRSALSNFSLLYTLHPSTGSILSTITKIFNNTRLNVITIFTLVCDLVYVDVASIMKRKAKLSTGLKLPRVSVRRSLFQRSLFRRSPFRRFIKKVTTAPKETVTPKKTATTKKVAPPKVTPSPKKIPTPKAPAAPKKTSPPAKAPAPATKKATTSITNKIATPTTGKVTPLKTTINPTDINKPKAAATAKTSAKATAKATPVVKACPIKRLGAAGKKAVVKGCADVETDDCDNDNEVNRELCEAAKGCDACGE
jgi:hypothetical protein